MTPAPGYEVVMPVVPKTPVAKNILAAISPETRALASYHPGLTFEAGVDYATCLLPSHRLTIIITQGRGRGRFNAISTHIRVLDGGRKMSNDVITGVGLTAGALNSRIRGLVAEAAE